MLFYSVFQTFHRKKDGSVVLKSLNPEGPFKRYLCDITLPAVLIRCQFFFCGQESKQRIFSPGERNLFLSFFWLNLLILTFVCSSIIPSTHDAIILYKSIFDFLLLLLITCPCHEFSQFFMKIIRGDWGHIKRQWDNHHYCPECSSCSRLLTCSTCSTWSEETWSLADNI